MLPTRFSLVQNKSRFREHLEVRRESSAFQKEELTEQDSGLCEQSQADASASLRCRQMENDKKYCSVRTLHQLSHGAHEAPLRPQLYYTKGWTGCSDLGTVVWASSLSR